MTYLTPEKRAELRERAESARPFVRHGGVDPAWTSISASDLLDLLDAADELAYTGFVEDRLSELLWTLTNGKLSKTSYPVQFMASEIEECIIEWHESDLRDECERLTDQMNRVLEVVQHYQELAQNDPYIEGPLGEVVVRLNEALRGDS